MSRVYLSGREEEHYQSPSSLPIPTVQATTQTTVDRRRRGGRRLRLNSTSSQDHVTNSNSPSKSLWVGPRDLDWSITEHSASQREGSSPNHWEVGDLDRRFKLIQKHQMYSRD